MPTLTIEVTEEQKQRYERGEAISITPPKQYVYTVATEKGNVFRVKPAPGVTFSEGIFRGIAALVEGECELIAKGSHPSPVGHVQRAVSANTITVIEVLTR